MVLKKYFQPAKGVLQDPSSSTMKALSQSIESFVSWQFNAARYSWVLSSLSRQAIPIAP